MRIFFQLLAKVEASDMQGGRKYTWQLKLALSQEEWLSEIPPFALGDLPYELWDSVEVDDVLVFTESPAVTNATELRLMLDGEPSDAS